MRFSQLLLFLSLGATVALSLPTSASAQQMPSPSLEVAAVDPQTDSPPSLAVAIAAAKASIETSAKISETSGASGTSGISETSGASETSGISETSGVINAAPDELEQRELGQRELGQLPPSSPVLTLPTTVDIPSDAAAPEYLNPEANDLLFPTQPNEVELVGTQPISLEQAIELGRRNNRDLQVARIELERSYAALREARAALLPTLDAGTGLTVQENQSNTIDTLFGGEQDPADTTLTGTLQLNYDLFTSGQRSAQIRAAAAAVQVQELQVESVIEQLQLDVTNDYYDLQEADEEVRIARVSLQQAEQSLRDAQALERAGVGTRFDVLSAEVDVANNRQDLAQALSQQQISRRQLAQRLSLTEVVDIAAADPVSVAADWTISLEDSIVMAYRNRAELEQQLLQREVSDQQRRAAQAALGPQVSLFADYNVQNVLNDGNTFRDTYRFGAQVQWRLFDGGAAGARADQERANREIAEVRFADVRNQVRFQVEQAYLTLQANKENIETAAIGLQQAGEALRLARLRFQAGVGTQTEVLRQQSELTRSERNQLQAILGYNRSLVTLRRAISNFPDGRLGDVP